MINSYEVALILNYQSKLIESLRDEVFDEQRRSKKAKKEAANEKLRRVDAEKDRDDLEVVNDDLATIVGDG